jgi:pilus assembly protein Flp/PilA
MMHGQVQEMGDPMLVALEFLLARYGIVLRDEEGQGLIEYVLIAALISIAAIGAIVLIGPRINTMFTDVGDALT